MILPDVNVVIYAHRSDRPEHEAVAAWLTGVVESDQAFGLADLVLSRFLRIVTNARVFDTPTPLAVALEFVGELRERPNRVSVQPGARHWDLFAALCDQVGAKGNLIADAYLAALAIESAVNGSRPTVTSPGSRACAGGIPLAG